MQGLSLDFIGGAPGLGELGESIDDAYEKLKYLATKFAALAIEIGAVKPEPWNMAAQRAVAAGRFPTLAAIDRMSLLGLARTTEDDLETALVDITKAGAGGRFAWAVAMVTYAPKLGIFESRLTSLRKQIETLKPFLDASSMGRMEEFSGRAEDRMAAISEGLTSPSSFAFLDSEARGFALARIGNFFNASREVVTNLARGIITTVGDVAEALTKAGAKAAKPLIPDIGTILLVGGAVVAGYILLQKFGKTAKEAVSG